jgi:lysophospholipase L1-like esterase
MRQILLIFISILFFFNTIGQTIGDNLNVKLTTASFSNNTSNINSKIYFSTNVEKQISFPDTDVKLWNRDRTINTNGVFASSNTPVALSLIPVGDSQPNKKLHILTLGDSNGTFSYGWPQQLKDEIPYVDVLNISRAGKTIGFNNNGDSTLNQLATLENDLLKANIYIGLEEYDYIVIGLGTNDAKYDFRNNQNKVYTNLELLIKRIRSCRYKSLNSAKIVIKSPTPYGTKSQSQKKYMGGNNRVKEMNTRFKEIAQKYNCIFVDTFTPLCNDIEVLSNDGLHLNEVGQKKIADLIAIEIKKAH